MAESCGLSLSLEDDSLLTVPSELESGMTMMPPSDEPSSLQMEAREVLANRGSSQEQYEIAQEQRKQRDNITMVDLTIAEGDLPRIQHSSSSTAHTIMQNDSTITQCETVDTSLHANIKQNSRSRPFSDSGPYTWSDLHRESDLYSGFNLPSGSSPCDGSGLYSGSGPCGGSGLYSGSGPCDVSGLHSGSGLHDHCNSKFGLLQHGLDLNDGLVTSHEFGNQDVIAAPTRPALHSSGVEQQAGDASPYSALGATIKEESSQCGESHHVTNKQQLDETISTTASEALELPTVSLSLVPQTPPMLCVTDLPGKDVTLSVSGLSGMTSSSSDPQEFCTLFVRTKTREKFPQWINSWHLEEHFADFRDELINARIIRDLASMKTKGFAFATFSSKASAEAAIQKYDGSYLLDQFQLHLEYERGRDPRMIYGKRLSESCMSIPSALDHEVSQVHGEGCPPNRRFSAQVQSSADIKGGKTQQRAVVTKVGGKAMQEHSCRESCTVFVGTKQRRKLPGFVNSRHLDDHFAQFGTKIVRAMIMRDTTTKKTRGYGLVTFRSPRDAKAAIEAFDGSKFLDKFDLHLSFYEKCTEQKSNVRASVSTLSLTISSVSGDDISSLSDHDETLPDPLYEVEGPSLPRANDSASKQANQVCSWLESTNVGADHEIPKVNPSALEPAVETKPHCIIIENLSCHVGADEIEALIQTNDLDMSSCQMSGDGSDSQTAVVSLGDAAQVSKAIAQLNGQSILGKRILVRSGAASQGIHEVPAEISSVKASTLVSTPPAQFEGLITQKIEMTEHMYNYTMKKFPHVLKRLYGAGGSIMYVEGGAIINAPTRDGLDKFISETVGKTQELTMTLKSRQWNRLMSVNQAGTSLFSELASPFTSNPNVNIHLIHVQLSILFVGDKEAILDASRYFSMALSKELCVDPVEMEGLLYLVPKLSQEILQKYEVKVRGFCQGSTEFSFEGSMHSLQKAKGDVERKISSLMVEKVTFQHPQILIASAQKRLESEKIQAYLHCPDVNAPSSLLLYICSLTKLALTAALEVVRSKPHINYVLISLGSVSAKVKSHFKEVEERYCIAIQCQPKGEQEQVLISGFVKEDVKEARGTLEKVLQEKSPLECTSEQNAYLRIILFDSPTKEGKHFLGSLTSIQVTCPKGQITLSGTHQAIKEAQKTILESQLLQGLQIKTFPFTCHHKFLSVIEKTVIQPIMNKQMDVIWFSEECDDSQRRRRPSTRPSFLITVFSTCADHFREACKIMQELKPQSIKHEIHSAAPMILTHKVINEVERKHQTRIYLHDRPVPAVLIHGLRMSDIDSSWSEIEELLDSRADTKEDIMVDFFQAKYIKAKHTDVITELKGQCEIKYPPVAKPITASTPKVVISITGKVKHVREAASKLKKLSSQCQKVEFQIKCPPSNIRVWRKRWEGFCREQERKYNLLVEFREEPLPLTRKPSRGDGMAAVTFILCGTDCEGMKGVKRLIIDMENGKSLTEKEVKMNDAQVETLQNGLKQMRVEAETKFSVIVDIDARSKRVSLKAPPSSESDLHDAEVEILRFVGDNTKTSKVCTADDPVIGLLLTSEHFGHFDRLLKAAKENQVLLQPLKRPQVGIELKGSQAGVANVKKVIDWNANNAMPPVAKEQLKVRSCCIPLFTTPEFKQLDLELQRDLCVICRYPKGIASVVVKEFHFRSVHIQICHGDLIEENVDAIVNAANEDLAHIGGIARAIVDNGGYEIQTESSKYVADHGKVKEGGAVCLGSGNLPCSRIIHAVGPRWKGGESGEESALFSAVTQSLKCAEQAHLKTVAFPAIGTGIFSVPLRTCALESIRASLKFLVSSPVVKTARFVLLSRKDAEVFSAVLDFVVSKSNLTAKSTSTVQKSPISESETASASHQAVQVSDIKEYQWSWRDDNGYFSPYPPHVCSNLSKVFATSPNGSCRYKSSGKVYIIDFQTMTQTNESTRYSRQVKHSPIPNSASVPSKGSLAQWYYRDDQQQFSPYNPQDSAKIESMFQGQCSMHGLVICGRLYKFDFQKNIQVNSKTRTERQIKRIPSLTTLRLRSPLELDDDADPVSEPARGAVCKVQWYYRDDQHQFSPYDPQDSARIERMYQERERYSNLVVIHKRFYSFDFQRMVQINRSTKFERTIKRDPPPDTFKEKKRDPGPREDKKIDDPEPPAEVVVTIRGPKASLQKAKAELTKQLRSMTTEYTLELPSSVNSALEGKLQAAATLNKVHCTITTRIVSPRSATVIKGSSTQTQGTRVMKLEGPRKAVNDTVTLIQAEIIKFQSQTTGASRAEPPPAEWEQQTSTVELFRVTKGTEEWKRVADNFEETMSGYSITEITRVQNKWLWDKYSQEKLRMHQKNSGRVNEMQLFHGTRNNDPEVICKSEEGFDMRHSKKGMWGKANYFATRAVYSDTYAYPHSSGCKEMLLAKVLTGDSYNSPPDNTLCMPPLKKTASHSSHVQLQQVYYDTVNGTAHSTQVYMTYSNDKAYPAYLIRYKHHMYTASSYDNPYTSRARHNTSSTSKVDTNRIRALLQRRTAIGFRLDSPAHKQSQSDKFLDDDDDY